MVEPRRTQRKHDIYDTDDSEEVTKAKNTCVWQAVVIFECVFFALLTLLTIIYIVYDALNFTPSHRFMTQDKEPINFSNEITFGNIDTNEE